MIKLFYGKYCVRGVYGFYGNLKKGIKIIMGDRGGVKEGFL